MSEVFVVELAPVTNANGSTTTFLFCAEPWATKPTDTPANTSVLPYLKNAGTVRREMFSGARITGPVTPAYGNIVLANPAREGVAGALDAWLGYGISGTRIVVRRGVIGTAYPASWSTVYIAYGHTLIADLSEITIRQRDRLQLLDKPAAPDAFLGTGDLEGPGGIANRHRFVSGEPGFIKPTLVDRNKQIYEVQSTSTGGLHDFYLLGSGAVAPFDVFDNGIELDRDQPHYASAANILATAPTVAGHVRYWFGDDSGYIAGWKNGPVYFRLASPPAGDLRVFAKGYPTDADHGRAGAVQGRFSAATMALRAGLTTADLAGTSEMAVSDQHIDDDRTYLQMLTDASAAFNGWFGFDRNDKFRSGFLLDPESEDPYFDIDDGVAGVRPSLPTTSVYSFTEHNTQGLRREPVGGMEVPVWSVNFNAGETQPSALANGASTELKDFLSREIWWSAQGVSGDTLLANPGAIAVSLQIRPRAIQTALDSRLFLERFFVLFGGRRDFWTFTTQMTAGVLALDLHDVVTLTSPRLGLSAGKKCRIVSITIDCASEVPSLSFTLWSGERGHYIGVGGSPVVPVNPTIARDLLPNFDVRGVSSTAAESAGAVAILLDNFDIRGFSAATDPPPSLLLQFEDGNGSTTIADSSQHARTLTGNANCKVSTAQAKFGTGSLHVTQRDSGGIAIATHADFAGTNNKWCVAFWFYHITTENSSDSPHVFRIDGSGAGAPQGGNYATTARTWCNWGYGKFIAPTAASSNAWHHCAIMFDPSQPVPSSGCICIDGTQVVLTEGTGWTGATASVRLFGTVGGTLGAADTSNYFVDSLALWIGHLPFPFAGGFTPPTAPH